MTAILATVFVASLVGSLHCVGMCGGLVAFYSGTDDSRGALRLLIHGIYSGGRLLAYSVLGLAAGFLGAVLDLAGSLAGFQRAAAIAAGIFMITWGVLALAQLGGVRVFRHVGSPGAARWLSRGLSLTAGRPPAVKAAAVGLLTGLLPCGWLWAFVVTAAGTGSPVKGVVVMAVFWAGTVPALLALGLGMQLLGTPLRRRIPAVTAVLLVLLGVLAVAVRPTSVVPMVTAGQAETSSVPACH